MNVTFNSDCSEMLVDDKLYEFKPDNIYGCYFCDIYKDNQFCIIKTNGFKTNCRPNDDAFIPVFKRSDKIKGNWKRVGTTQTPLILLQPDNRSEFDKMVCEALLN